jgi:hypothetical protein
MTEHDENPEEATEAAASPEAPADEPPAEPPAPPPPQWEYRTGFKVVGRMKEIIHLSIEVSNAEIRMLRKKIDKLTYGS